jgi:murein DD-endopeptidase MepM/ murein hydrolase activator NlpD
MRAAAPSRPGWSTQPKPILGRRGIVALLFVAMFGGLFVSVTPPSASASDPLTDAYAKQAALQALIKKERAQIAALAANQAALSGRISATQGSLNAVISNVTAVKTQIVQMVVQVADAQASVDELSASLDQLNQQLADVEAQETTKQAELDARKAILASRIRTAYDTDRTSLLETILSSSDFTDVISEVGYQLDFAGQDKALAEQIVADQKVLTVIHATVVSTKRDTDELKAAAAAEKATLDGQLSELAAARTQLAALEAQTKAMLAAQQAQYATLAANKAQLAAALAAAAKAEAQVEKLIEKLVLEALNGGGIPSQYSGSLAWPIHGIITQEFGCTGFYLEPPYGSCPHFHRGIDIANSMYTPIHAAGPGKVIFSGKDPYSTTWMVVIAHSTHLVSWYLHVDNAAHPPIVHAGQYVYTGQVIAYVGMTGNTTGPHLHWAVQLNNIWVNPRLFL